MRSDTKRWLGEAEPADIVRRALGAELAERVELTDGTFNAAYRLGTDDGRDVPWWSCRERLTAGQRAGLRRELGGIVARLHRIEGTSFGYPQGPGGDTWRGAFAAMATAVLDDAARFGVDLPEGLAGWFQDRSAVLDEVATPVLVHFDLWEGNVFVDPAGERVVGLIDPERAFWGDPLADLVSIALFADVEDDQDFLDGYGAGKFTRSMRERLRLYRVYLYLIMIVEGVPRGFAGEEHERSVRFYREKLAADLGGRE